MNTKKKPTIKYIAASAPAALADYIESKGYSCERIAPLEQLPAGIADHPDLRVIRLGLSDDAPVLRADDNQLGGTYPKDVPFNAACTGRYLICNPAYTAPEILEKAKDFGMQIISVKQGYAKCSCVVVDENSIITYDCGIARECEAAGMNVLRVVSGSVMLEGYSTGFIGGASGRIDDEIIFCGNLAAHPDYRRMRDFIEARGLKCTFFEAWPLTDIGSII